MEDETMAEYDINEIDISGAVERFAVVETKTGTPMIRFTLRCWKELIQVVAFKEQAGVRLREGERVEVKGYIQSTRWTDKDGNAKSGFQVVANKGIFYADALARFTVIPNGPRPLEPRTMPPVPSSAQERPGPTAQTLPMPPGPQAERPGVMVAGENENLPF